MCTWTISISEQIIVALYFSASDLHAQHQPGIQRDLRELKSDFRAAVARLDQQITTAVTRLEGDIKALVAKAESDLKEFAKRVETQLAEMRAEDKALRDKIDKNHEVTTEKISVLDRKVDRIGVRLAVLVWLIGVLGTATVTIVTVGKALHWWPAHHQQG